MAKYVILWPVFSLREEEQDLPPNLSYSTESLTLALNWEEVL